MTTSDYYNYHIQTKHTIEKLLYSPHYLDWANQPDPFRIYHQSPSIKLSHEFKLSSETYFDVIESIDHWNKGDPASHGEVPSPDACFVSNLLFYSMAISAWKQIRGTNHRWALRVSASSGNLHPTETYVLVNRIEGLEAGLYHYRVDNHNLELRSKGSHAFLAWQILTGNKFGATSLRPSLLNKPCQPVQARAKSRLQEDTAQKTVHLNESACPPLLIALASIYWREIWKYKERGFRYCQHDLGHALASIFAAAASFGYYSFSFGLFPDDLAGQLLGTTKGDERPSLFIALWPHNSISDDAVHVFDRSTSLRTDLGTIAEQVAEVSFFGKPNVLSKETIEYSIADQIETLTTITEQSFRTLRSRQVPAVSLHSSSDLVPIDKAVSVTYFGQDKGDPGHSMHKTIRTRRSAVDFDGHKRMTLSHLTMILASATRGFAADFQQSIPLSATKFAHNNRFLINLYLYIHRVDGISPGVYYYDRLNQSLTPLIHGDQRELIKVMSCIQDIAADGCLALSMVADFNLMYNLYGDRGYRLVHYEAGFIGQHLYLAATALGYDATGIGCFVDDAINTYLKLKTGNEVIYNFTIGGAVQDPRLTTLPAYDFLGPSNI